MTVQQEPTLGDVVAPRADGGNVVRLRDAPLVARADPTPSSPVTDLSNVIPFARGRRGASEATPPPIVIGPDDRPAPRPAARSFPRDLVTLAAALAAHGLLVFAFWQEPRELPSIGVEAIEVEIVVGDNRPAGAASTPGESEAQPSAPAEAVTAEEKPVEAEPQRTAEVRELTPEEKQAEVAKEQPVDELQTEVAREPSPEQQPDTRSQIAMAQTPQAAVPTALPRETPPDMSAVISPPREEPNEVQPVEPKAKQPAQKRAEPKKAELKKVEQQKKAQKQAARPASTPSEGASGSGRQAVASNANYNGRVAAHLARYKQYPASARGSGIQGSGAVTFSLSGSGSVTSVAVVRGTGAAVLDQELAAMVRRASPFPAPPNGQSLSFTVPVSFKLH